MNEKRKMILYGLLALVVVGYAFDVGVRKFYDEPLAEREARLTKLQRDLSTSRKRLASLKNAPRELEALQARSLPRDLELARAAYQNWLLELVQEVELQQPKVDASEPAPRRKGRKLLFHVMNFTVRGRGDMAQVTQLLHKFYANGNLHKIRSLSVVPLGGSESLDVSLAIEAIILPNADRADRLAEVASDRLVSPVPADYQRLARRNLFAIGGAGTPGHRLTVSAITSDIRGIKTVWVTDDTTGQTVRYQAGESIRLGLFDAEIFQVDDDRLLMHIDGQPMELRVGNRVSDARPTTAAGTATGVEGVAVTPGEPR